MTIQLIEALEERLRVAMVTSNLEELGQLLADELVFITFLGESISKRQDLDAHASGYLQIHTISLSDSRIKLLSTGAVVTCCAEIDATFDDERTCKQFRFTRVWAPDTQGNLQVITGQATFVFASI